MITVVDSYFSFSHCSYWGSTQLRLRVGHVLQLNTHQTDLYHLTKKD